MRVVNQPFNKLVGIAKLSMSTVSIERDKQNKKMQNMM